MPVFNAVLTNQAEDAALDYENTQITLQITHVGFGTSTAVADLNQLSVLGEVGRVSVAGGGIEPNSRTMTANVIWTPDQVRDIGQIGFYAGDKLFCIYAPGTAIVRVTPDVGIAASFSVSLVRLPNGSVNIVVNDSLSPMMLLLGQHQSNPDPHQQYTMKAAFNSHVAQNALEHNNLSAMIQAVNQRVANLEIREEVQIGEFIITDDPRNPVLYKGYGEWRLVPNVMLSGLDLGGVTGQVRQIALGAGQNVRTTFFWRRIDPNSVPPTRTVTIAEDAFEISLRDLFEAQYGEPVIGEQVNFVIADGVLVTAYNTSNHAIVTGDWPPQTGLFMDNYGIVAGRGGRGGTGIGETTPPEAKHGFDGGPAILATYPLALNNLNTVAGGGAGGGASANWRATAGTASVHIGNVGGSGGAPYGEAGDLGVVNEGIDSWGDGLPGDIGGRTTGGAAVTRTETRVGSTLNHFGGAGGGLGQNGGVGSGSGFRTGGDFYPNEWRAGGTGGLAGVAVTGPVAVTGNPVLGR